MSTSSTTAHNLPEFPYSPASDARRCLSAVLSSSHFVTTVVSPPPHRPSATHQEDNADTPLTVNPPFNADSSSADISTRSPPPVSAEIPPVFIETSRSQSFNHTSPPRADSRSLGIQTLRFKSSKQVQPPSQAYSFKQFPVPIGTGQDCITRPSPRRRSAWHRFKLMGNRLVTPLRSIGHGFIACVGGRRAVAFCEDFSAHDTSPGSSWYSSGEYPPEFICAVLENNVLLRVE